MNLAECRKAEDHYSGKASDIARSLAFARIAVVWIFKADSGGQKVVPFTLAWPTLLIVAGLVIDLGQYVFGATYWGWFVRRKERELVVNPGTDGERFDEERQFTNPLWSIRVMDCLFYAKIACVAIAYLLLFAFLVGYGLFG